MTLRAEGLVTLPALMQLVQTFILRVVPPTWTRILWMLGFQRRLVRRCEWLTLIPKEGRLSQISQTEAIVGSLGRLRWCGVVQALTGGVSNRSVVVG